jgi:sensor domain CHASE-containing protein
MESNRGRYILVGIIAFVVGWAIGLFIFGWNIWPLKYTGALPKDLTDSQKQTYVVAMADLFAYQGNQQRMQQTFANWPDADQAICQLYNDAADVDEAARLNALAQTLNGSGCAGVMVAPDTGEAGGGRSSAGFIALICGLLAILAVVIVAILVIWQRRGTGAPDDAALDYDMGAAESNFTVEDAAIEQRVTPLARFQTTYSRGHDTYDESFSIENADGDFLGECGVGLSETLGADVPKNVTAFEVWLFDKNDIRTVTKVVMSDHAFFDEAIKAKLAPKGEPVLARPNETIVLETATLIVNAAITELEYGTGALPPQSFFERFTVELSAWNKEGDFQEPDIQGRVDEMLDF